MSGVREISTSSATFPNFPKQHWSLAATDFAVRPWVFNLIPIYGLAGSKVAITGVNLNGAQRVLFGGASNNPASGVTASFSVLSSTTISATVPTPAPTGIVRVTTPLGTSTDVPIFTGLPPLVPVPNVVGDSLQVASQILQNAGLQIGISPPGATGDVVSQTPPPPPSVEPGSRVDLVVNTSPGPGYSKITLTNNLENNESVYIWLYDSSTGRYTEQNGGDNKLAFNNSITVSLPSSTYYYIYAVDPARSSCDGDDPQDTNCLAWELPWFLGNPAGPTYTCKMDAEPCPG
jgi:hypothetical protein